MKKTIAITLIVSLFTVTLVQSVQANQIESQSIGSEFKSLSQIFVDFDRDNPTPEQQFVMSIIPEDMLDKLLGMAESMDTTSISPKGWDLTTCLVVFAISWYVLPWQLGLAVLVLLVINCF